MLISLSFKFSSDIDGLIKRKEKIRKYHKKIGQKKFYNELLKLDPKNIDLIDDDSFIIGKIVSDKKINLKLRTKILIYLKIKLLNLVYLFRS